MTTLADDIHSTQQFANAAEVFVGTLSAFFPGNYFETLFHGGTLRRAYWMALKDVVQGYDAASDEAALLSALMNGQAFADPRVVEELLKEFLPQQTPNYPTVARLWAETLNVQDADKSASVEKVRELFTALADALRRSPELGVALHQIAQMRASSELQWDDTTTEQDLNRLLDAALVTGASTLELQTRHLLALAAERPPHADAVPEQSLAAVVRLAEYLPSDALRGVWERVAALPNSTQRVRLLGVLATHLVTLPQAPDPLAVVRQALDEARPPLAPDVRVDVLLSLAPHLEAADSEAMTAMQGRILAGMQTVRDAASRVRALGALIPYLVPSLQSQAVVQAFETAMQGITGASAQAEALSELPAHLPVEFHERLLNIAEQLDAPEARALLLGNMIPHLSPALQVQALESALSAVAAVSGEDARTRALIALASPLETVGMLSRYPETLQRALELTFSIAFAGDRARAFAALAPQLSPELLSEALHIVRDIVDDADRAHTLARLAPHLPPDLLVAAFNIAQELRPTQARALALIALAPYLSPAARQQALEDALAAALAIERRYERVTLLVDLAPHLTEPLRQRALHEALTATRSIPDESERAQALVFLTPHLLEEQLPDALADAYTILDPLERTPVLSALLPRLPEEPRFRVGQDVLETARELRPPHHKAGILATVAPVLPEELIADAVRVADHITTPYDRLHVLTALLPRAPERLLDAALAAAHAVLNRLQRVNALLELIPYLTPSQRAAMLEDVLETALGVTDDYDRASALAHLAPYVDIRAEVQGRRQEALALALETCLDMRDATERGHLLARVAGSCTQWLTPAQAYALWRDYVPVLRERTHADLLSDLAALAPMLAHMGATRAPEAMARRLRHVVLGDALPAGK